MSSGEKRARNRSKMVVGLRMSCAKAGSNSAAGTMVHTLDISSSGARLAGLRERIEPGDIILLQRQHKRAKGKVMWCREIAPREIQIGIQFLETDASFWGVELAENKQSADEKKLWSLLAGNEK